MSKDASSPSAAEFAAATSTNNSNRNEHQHSDEGSTRKANSSKKRKRLEGEGNWNAKAGPKNEHKNGHTGTPQKDSAGSPVKKQRREEVNGGLAGKGLSPPRVNGTSGSPPRSVEAAPVDQVKVKVEMAETAKKTQRTDSRSMADQLEGQAPAQQQDQPRESNQVIPQDQKLEQGQDASAPSTDATGSPFFMQTTSFYLPLSPISQSSPLEGLCAEHLSPLILTYCPPLNGVVLSYSSARFSARPATQRGSQDGATVLSRAVDEYGPTFVWITADFLVLRPVRDSWIKGHISVQSESHIGLVCWNLFNASIERECLPPSWEWVAVDTTSRRGKKHQFANGATTPRSRNERATHGVGHWVDGNGNALDEEIRFRVLDFDSLPAFGKDKSFMSIQGSLLTKEGDEEELGPGEQAGRAAQKRQRRKLELDAEEGQPQANDGAESSSGVTEEHASEQDSEEADSPDEGEPVQSEDSNPQEDERNEESGESD